MFYIQTSKCAHFFFVISNTKYAKKKKEEKKVRKCMYLYSFSTNGTQTLRNG